MADASPSTAAASAEALEPGTPGATLDPRATDATDATGATDDDRAAALVRLGIPAATLLGFLGALGVAGLAPALLVLGGGVLVGAVALFWASLRALGDDVEASDDDALTATPRAAQKARLLRALKDLEQEKAIGKLDEADFVSVSARYRDELKVLLREEDEAAAPYLAKAEALVGAAPAPAPAEAKTAVASPAEPPADADAKTDARLACPSCAVANEPDARFCKGCGATLAPAPSETPDPA